LRSRGREGAVDEVEVAFDERRERLYFTRCADCAARVELKRHVIVDVRPVDAELKFEPIAESISAEQREADITVERDGRSAIELDIVTVLIKKVDTKLPTFAA
jgi:hypothetical protein